MADEHTTTSFPDRQGEGRQGEGRRGGRPGPGREGGREPGGFRIRLSDNEMRAARALQEAFGLRSTVAVLGFALRTTAQLLEEGKLDVVAEQQRSEGRRSDVPRGGRRDPRSEGRQERAPRVDPFARPSRPPAPQPVVEVAVESEPASEPDAAIAAADAAEPGGEA